MKALKALNITVPVSITRDGLDLTIKAGNYAKTLVNLQEHFGLDGDQAFILRSWLDDNHIEMAIEPKAGENEAGTTINIDRLVESGWVRYPEEDQA